MFFPCCVGCWLILQPDLSRVLSVASFGEIGIDQTSQGRFLSFERKVLKQKGFEAQCCISNPKAVEESLGEDLSSPSACLELAVPPSLGCHGCSQGMWLRGGQQRCLGQLKKSLQCRTEEILGIHFLSPDV